MNLTYDMLMELKAIAEESIIEMGYQVPNYTWHLDTRCTSRAGQCRYTKKQIGVSPKVMQYHSTEKALNTCVHELLHAVAYESFNCNGHTGKWKELANQYNYEYSHRMPIERCYKETDEQRKARSIKNKNRKQESVKHQVRCEGCGHIFRRKRVSKFIKAVYSNGAENYTCSCGSTGKFTIIQ